MEPMILDLRKINKGKPLKDYYHSFQLRKDSTGELQTLKNEIEYCIKGMFNIRDFLYNEKVNNEKQMELPEWYPPILYEKNCHYIVGAYELLTLGLFNPAHSLIRTIIEDIWIIYMTSFDTKEYIHNYHKIKHTEFCHLYNMDNEFTLEGINKRDYNNYSISMRLYNKKTQKEMYTVYSKLSDSVHSSITGHIYNGKADLKKVKEEYENLLNIIFANIAAMWEIYHDKELIEYNDYLLYYIDFIGKYLGKLTNFSPNSEKYKPKIQSTWDYFKPQNNDKSSNA